MENVIVPASAYGTRVPDVEREEYLGDIIDRAAARQRERRAAGAP